MEKAEPASHGRTVFIHQHQKILKQSSLLDWRSNQLSYGAALFIFANLLLLSLAANIYCHLDCLIDFER
jgi:hypothetical protein